MGEKMCLAALRLLRAMEHSVAGSVAAYAAKQVSEDHPGAGTSFAASLDLAVFYGLWLARHTRSSTMRASASPAGGVWPPALGQPLGDPNASSVPRQVWVPAGSDMRLSFWAPCTFGTCLGGEVRPATTGN